jgi:predicted O-methyltransferase YrrM
VTRRSEAKTVTGWPHLDANVLAVRDFACLQRALGWNRAPLLDAPHLHEFDYLEDLNERRLRDAEVICGACCNGAPQQILEIGTAGGETTALMARNAPTATVHTVNIPPEEIDAGGVRVTRAFSRDEIGRVYREQGCTNVRQVLANTRTWQPDVARYDVAFIDGCHDADFVYNDTGLVLSHCGSGSLILWHDFNPELARVYHWIGEVCSGVERLYSDGLVRGRILHLRDSWVGLYRVP